MKSIFILLVSVAFASSYYLDDGAVRNRRDVTYEKSIGSGTAFGTLSAPETGGAMGKIGYQGTLMNNDHGRINGQGYAHRTLGLPGGPQSGLGGHLDWTGNRGAAALDVVRTRGLGTQVDAQARGTIHRFNKNAEIGGYGRYSQQFGGPFGRQRPNYGVGVNFRGRF